MATYRVLMLGEDNHFSVPTIIDCSTDTEAMARAPEIAADHRAMEVGTWTAAWGV